MHLDVYLLNISMNMHECYKLVYIYTLECSQQILSGRPTYDTNLLAYTNFHKHAQTHTSIHTYNLVSFIVNP